MASLPADRTKLALAQSNQNPGNVLGSSQNKNALTEAYDTVDLLNQKVDGLVGSSTLSPYPPAQYNRLINGNFDVWQRGVSTVAIGFYTADRWLYGADGTGQASTISQQSFTPGQGIVPNEPKYYLRLAVTTAATGQTFNILSQRIESVGSFAGLNVTLSFWAKAETNRTASSRAVQNFGSGGSASVVSSGGTHNLTTSWQKFTTVITIPSISGKTIGSNDYLSLELNLPINTLETIDIAQVQVNVGNQALPFQPRSIAEEFALCQRYYEKSYTYADVTGANTYTGTVVTRAQTTSEAWGGVIFSVQKRVAPTVNIYAKDGTSSKLTGYGGGSFGTTVTAASIGTHGFTAVVDSGIGFTAGTTYCHHFTADAEL